MTREGSGEGAGASAYVTYESAEDARLAIQAVNNHIVDGHTIRASFGTTKYCNMFLRGMQCNNSECLFLHKLGDDDASFTKDQMQPGNSQFSDMTRGDTAGGGAEGGGAAPGNSGTALPPCTQKCTSPATRRRASSPR